MENIKVQVITTNAEILVEVKARFGVILKMMVVSGDHVIP